MQMQQGNVFGLANIGVMAWEIQKNQRQRFLEIWRNRFEFSRRILAENSIESYLKLTQLKKIHGRSKKDFLEVFVFIKNFFNLKTKIFCNH